MAKIRYNYLVRDVTRHGQVRWYVRRPGQNKVRLKLTPEDEGFTKEYKDALKTKSAKPGTIRVQPYSLGWLINQYFASAHFAGLAKATQVQQRSILGRVARENGDKDARTLTSAAVKAGRDKRAQTPGAANNFLKSVKALYVWGIEAGHVKQNPAIGVKRAKMGKSTWLPWTPEQREQFCRAHPIGTMPRLVYALAYEAAFRRSDIVTVGRQHIKDGFILKTQEKTDEPVWVPISPELQACIDAMPKTGLHLVTTAYGKPFSVKGIGGAMQRWLKQAGLEKAGLSLHGLRKAAGADMAEGGATQEEIAAALGHSGTKTASIYTKSADKKRLARQAQAKRQGTSATQSVPPESSHSGPVGQKRRKSQ
ncbi:tyrosine-type recombinase/integrase [Henriciella sp.]|uniref:tyrosine-type recombinase/integrase n=1 Tax=Henriciella sp. TaxID=1968823 RepID=UPI0025C18195|nr:tyrosine-type recombinase/integrase [Henriciella sp.]